MIVATAKEKPQPAKTPRISVNKLAEYLEAIPTRRKQIVKDAKYPAKFITTRYKDARDGTKHFLSSNMDEEYVLGLIERLESIEEFDTEFQEQDINLSIQCLESLLDCDVTLLGDFRIKPFEDENKLVHISGVDISVNPDLVVEKEIEGKLNIGAIKLHISKTYTLTEESQKIVAVMLYNYVIAYLLEGSQVPNLKLCCSFDLFNKTIESCPSSFKHRMKKIEAACEEISLWWDSL